MRLFSSLVVASLLLLSSAASAGESAGADEVTLKNGGTIRGTVVSSEPGTSVKIIEMGETKTRTIPWGEVADVERGKYGSTEVQPGAAGPGYAAAPPPETLEAKPDLSKNGVVRLHVESPLPVEVYEHAPPVVASVGRYAVVLDQSRLVCKSPCDEVLDGRDGKWFSARGDFPGGTSFALTDLKGDQELSVVPGSKGMRIGGILGTSLGGAAIVGGAMTALFGGIENSDDTTVIGGAVIGVGAAALIGGIVLIVVSSSDWDLHEPGQGPATKAAAPRYYLGEF